jgi:hypothetical protein
MFINKNTLLSFFVFLLIVPCFAQNPNFHIYLCFGQSNMVGQGTIQSQDLTVNSRFKLFQALNCPNLGRTKETWYASKPPTCQCYSNLSPVDYFGKTMIANLPDSITIGIINVAISGCDIRLFDKDIYQDYDSTYTASWFTSQVQAYGGNPYQYLVNLAQLAQQDGVIKGILLHQGETNTGQANWPKYVKKIYNDMLADLSLAPGSVPLLTGQVFSGAGNCCSSMNTIINRLPDTLSTAYVISSSGCTGQDAAHFDSEGYRKLGRRYAVQMLSLLGYKAVYAEGECGTVGTNWSMPVDANASNTNYVTALPGNENLSTPPTDDASIIHINFSVSADTTYYIYGRFNNPDMNANSFWVKVDNGNFVLYENLTTSGWEWMELTSLDLIAGSHVISIGIAENGAKLDKLVIKNSHITPVGLGEEAIYLCQPEINIKRGSTNIASGGSFGFGSVNTGSNSTLTFTIENTGSATLNLTGIPKIAISGADFTVNQTATSSTIAAGSSTTFTVTFSPASAGAKNATLTISNNDTDEGTYTIHLTGTGTSATGLFGNVSANSFETLVGPNPSNGIYNFNTSEKIDEVIVSDCMGNIILNNSDSQIDLSSRPSGIYFLTIISGEKRFFGKLVKN